MAAALAERQGAAVTHQRGVGNGAAAWEESAAVTSRTSDGFLAAGTQRAAARVVVQLTVRESLVIEEARRAERLVALLNTQHSDVISNVRRQSDTKRWLPVPTRQTKQSVCVCTRQTKQSVPVHTPQTKQSFESQYPKDTQNGKLIQFYDQWELISKAIGTNEILIALRNQGNNFKQ